MASEFEYYLRTGRRQELQIKFNPWHDPEDGRFTFANQGRYFPRQLSNQRRAGNSRAFGGGSFGGGGAGGSWGGSSGGGGATGGWQSPSAGRPARAVPSPAASSPRLGLQRNRAPREPRSTVRTNGYEFSIDAHARTRRVTGEIRLQSQSRSRSAQSNAGKPDRRTTDDGGHYIAARFNGPREWFNHLAQDANFNRGAYRALEDQWARAVRAGRRVFVDIVSHYRGSSMRPYKLDVIWIIDRQEHFDAFPNEPRRR